MGHRPWPARNSMSRIWVRRSQLKARIRMTFRFSGSEFGCGSDVRGPGGIRRIASRHRKSAPQPPSRSRKHRNSVEHPSQEGPFRAQIRLIGCQAGHGCPSQSGSFRDPLKLPLGRSQNSGHVWPEFGQNLAISACVALILEVDPHPQTLRKLRPQGLLANMA